MSHPDSEIHLKGLPVSPGVAIGPVCLLNEHRHTVAARTVIAPEALEHETQLLRDALLTVGGKLALLVQQVKKRAGPGEAAIFSALKTMLDDPGLQKRLFDSIANLHSSAETAVTTTFDHYARRMQAVSNSFIKERAADIRDLKTHLIEALHVSSPLFQCEGELHCQRGGGRIVVAAEMTPSLAVRLDAQHTRGFVTEQGGEASHAAILARSLGVPAVSGIPGIYRTIACGTVVLINGTTGDVYIRPTRETTERELAATAAVCPALRSSKPVPGLVVLANISRAGDVGEALQTNAEGIGLYRTEFEFIAAGAVLDEEQQYQRYAAVVQQLRGAPVYIRLLDVGGDKPLPGVPAPQEANPYLGCRGARFLLAHGELLRTQARALARASRHGTIGVLYPMIADAAQFAQVRTLIEQAVADVPHGRLRHGVLFEVPAACLAAEEIFAAADFGSVGTNDLTQYLFAVDRGNELVAHDYTPDRPVFWSLLRSIARAASVAQRPLSVCGELAGDPRYTRHLIEAGIRIVSVNPRSIAQVRDAARVALSRVTRNDQEMP